MTSWTTYPTGEFNYWLFDLDDCFDGWGWLRLTIYTGGYQG
jgi:hypothetical protein